MKLAEALSSIHQPVGVTSLINAVFGGDLDSIKCGQAAQDESMNYAKESLWKAQQAQRECKSDAAYWGYMGQISYWKAVVNILEAADLVGADNLPDGIDKPPQVGILMDLCSKVEGYGQAMLEAAKKAAKQADCERVIEVGSFVNYHSIIGGEITSRGHKVNTIEMAPNNFGTDVAWITGKSGCVALDALSLATDMPNAVIMGDTVYAGIDNAHISPIRHAMVIQFDNKEQMKQALENNNVSFTVMGD